MFARVVHSENLISVGVIDLTGSENAKWSEVTPAGKAHPSEYSRLGRSPEIGESTLQCLAREATASLRSSRWLSLIVRGTRLKWRCHSSKAGQCFG